MIAESGHYALVLALGLALIQSVVPLIGARLHDTALMNVARSTALAQLLFVGASFMALVMLHVSSDFSVANVYENSHSMKPLLYKITGVWGNHEGSMLLWVSILALFGGLVAAFGNNLPLSLRAHVLSVQGWIASAFYLFILMTSNPFLRITSPPLEGRDLNPVLQDIGLAVHPPMLYLGYVGFSISFSFAIAALMEGRIDAAWARWVRPWTLVAWIFLTLGIAMGSYWAYYELGWGGWWFWDPVENASLMPWLAGTALLHSALVMEKRNALKVWTILLSILTFSLSLLGTFLVRSGVITSVHAFATDPTRGVFILLILCLFIGGSLALFAGRATSLKQGGLFAPISREGALVLNNLLLTVACAVVLFGTLYPLAMEMLADFKMSVGAPFYNLTFAPLFALLLFAVPFGPMLAWKRGDLLGVTQRLLAAGVASLVAIAIAWAWARGGSALAPLAIGLGVFVIAGAVTDIVERTGLVRLPFATVLNRARGLPRSAWGTTLAHAGLGVALIGIVCETTWNSEYIATMKQSDVAHVAGYDVKLDRLFQRQGPNYREMIAEFNVSRDGETLSMMTPSKRSFTTRGSSTTEAALLTRGASQLYVSLGDATAEGAIAVRIYYKPMVLLIWWGPVLMAFGGVLSLSDRRLRVGAPKPARAKQRLQPAE
ncbi:heme lyase CcmF/NrfE family subunit [Bradyrhizobium sp. 180]|uniref:heme lyase CcmF/NrfE family subunit n=1 Tax=unclassified Bradyrhizobium TaxID=2631580 RepID=UPI001FFA71AA|nr:heme lyase CcmF/NrfE family subunit [Bradyrhizobium sp. CW12]MCK1489642.1 heme lyase CcmF/NrfE family subunit [Bradyrhizobium sp. 180]MCK1530648.1 heme lyase CcmF/NrfE family subunit [Bradyrhizobium sp. 182]MCK1594778.1 heme lyase CcmF/NrfE family subunit [Bradyrhizobium sp. 164]MCK1646314.1 heme lyase CcmF/NrfE family subunit [Bradyrhizobium sp. 154]MCK1664124.1 heme lyase CcmF/NrfE family subunit [Bradyrhizobium sp. 153]MCK1754264.1 heme lyase CcmF/NrfE family subunit [Bradyrhizobium sp.